MGRAFYVYPNKQGVFVAEILDPKTGARVCYRNTGAKNRDQAVMAVTGWLRDGIPARKRGRPPEYDGTATQTAEAAAGLSSIMKSIEKTADLDAAGALTVIEALRKRGLVDVPAVKAGPGNADFTGYLENFWDYDSSPYVREKLAYKQRITRRHCYEIICRMRKYWVPAFKGRALNSVTRNDLKEFSMALAGKGLAPASINKIMLAGTVALSWAFREGHIADDPTKKLIKFSVAPKKPGILTPPEAQLIFASPWEDRRAYIGNLLAMTTGLRHGEILALRKNSIDGQLPVLHITHSWSNKDGLKEGTKNGESRKVPVLPEVKKMLLELLTENPHGGGNPFIFWGMKPGSPSAWGDFLRNGLKKAMGKAGIDYKARNIVFHSHRHFYCARLADKMTAEQIQRISGHKSRSVFESYADHVIDENLAEMGKAGEEIFGKILPFRKMA